MIIILSYFKLFVLNINIDKTELLTDEERGEGGSSMEKKEVVRGKGGAGVMKADVTRMKEGR